MKHMAVTENILLDMLSCALVEMRAHSNPNYTKVIADIFHNVPARLISKAPPLDIYDDMQKVAKRHSVEAYLSSLFEHSYRKHSKDVDSNLA